MLQQKNASLITCTSSLQQQQNIYIYNQVFYITRVIENTGESVQWVVAVFSGSALLYLRTVYRECSNDRGHRVAAKNQTYTQADFWLLSVAKSSRNELAKLCGHWPVVHFFPVISSNCPLKWYHTLLKTWHWGCKRLHMQAIPCTICFPITNKSFQSSADWLVGM